MRLILYFSALSGSCDGRMALHSIHGEIRSWRGALLQELGTRKSMRIVVFLLLHDESLRRHSSGARKERERSRSLRNRSNKNTLKVLKSTSRYHNGYSYIASWFGIGFLLLSSLCMLIANCYVNVSYRHLFPEFAKGPARGGIQQQIII